MGVYRGIVYKPDLRFGFGNRQLGVYLKGVYLVSMLGFDNFIWPMDGWSMCIVVITYKTVL